MKRILGPLALVAFSALSLSAQSATRFCPDNCYAGDNRSFSTGVDDPNQYKCTHFTNTNTVTTSRIIGVVRFLLPQLAPIGKGCAYSDPSEDWLGNTATAQPTIKINANSGGGFHIEIAGTNPLVVPQSMTPAIHTKLDITGQNSSGQVCFSGHLYGSQFPDSELFFVNTQLQATTLITYATTHGPNWGPFTLAFTSNSDMGSFSNVCASQ